MAGMPIAAHWRMIAAASSSSCSRSGSWPSMMARRLARSTCDDDMNGNWIMSSATPCFSQRSLSRGSASGAHGPSASSPPAGAPLMCSTPWRLKNASILSSVGPRWQPSDHPHRLGRDRRRATARSRSAAGRGQRRDRRRRPAANEESRVSSRRLLGLHGCWGCYLGAGLTGFGAGAHTRRRVSEQVFTHSVARRSPRGCAHGSVRAD